ncbi:MAG: hypothetical protein OXD48_03275 [Litoreibacter sp.]|nr:hypothetical protein [Litoreibacter sp.]
MSWLLRGERPSWSLIAVMLAFGIALTGFGNADRILWRVTSHGAQMPGLVVDIRSYRLPDQVQEVRVPKVAFRDAAGKVRIMEPARGTWRGRVEVDQPVLVALRGRSIVVDVPFQRRPLTDALLWALTGVGLTAWGRAIFLLIKRIAMRPRSPRELA